MKDSFKFSFRVPLNTFHILQSDTQLFGIKSLNSLLNQIFVNFFELFKNDYINYRSIQNIIKEELNTPFPISNDSATNITKKVIEIFNHNLIKTRTKLISFTASKDSIHIFKRIISNALLDEPSLRFLMKSLTIAYSNLSTIEKEKIIFKKHFEILQKAIKNKNKIKIKYKHTGIPYTTCYDPYDIIEAQNDFGNIVCVKDSPNKLVRMHLRFITNIEIQPNSTFKNDKKIEQRIKEYKDNGYNVIDQNTIDIIAQLISNKTYLNLFSKIHALIKEKSDISFSKEQLNKLLKIAYENLS
jgi:hypothetical protein